MEPSFFCPENADEDGAASLQSLFGYYFQNSEYYNVKFRFQVDK